MPKKFLEYEEPPFIYVSKVGMVNKVTRVTDDFNKKMDYLVTLIKFPFTPTHLPLRMTYDKND